MDELERMAAERILGAVTFLMNTLGACPPGDRLRLIHDGPYAYDLSRQVQEIARDLTDLIVLNLQKRHKTWMLQGGAP